MCGRLLREQLAEAVRGREHRAVLRADKPDDAERAVRRIKAEFAERDFLFIKGGVILPGGQLQHRVAGHGGLDQRAAGQVGAAAAADDLGDEAEHALIRAESLPEQHRIDAKNADERDFFKVQPFGDHLCAKQDVILLPGKAGQHLFVRVFLGGGILVHAQDARCGQQLLQFLLHALGAEAAVRKLAAARRAQRGRGVHRMAAVVAQKRRAVFVVDERHAAVGALENLAAVGAHRDRVVAAAVEQQDALLAAAQVFGQLLGQAGADLARVAGGEFGAHVGKLDAGQRAAAVTVFERHHPNTPALGGKGRFGARRGRSEDEQRVFGRGTLAGDLMRRVARRGFALVGVLLFFIQNDEPDVLQRRKDRAAGADDDIGVAALDHPPLQKALGVVEGRVLHGQTAAEHRLEAADHLRRQANFRHKHKGAAAQFQRALDQLDEHRRFAAARDAVKQRRARAASRKVRGQLVIGGLLLGGKLHRLRVERDRSEQIERFVPLADTQNAFFA